MKAFYTTFLLRIEWDRDRGILGGEIQRAYPRVRSNPKRRFFRGLDVDRIAEFVNANLEVPRVEPEEADELD